MFSKEFEELIDAILVDGVVDESEKIALMSRADKEGVDFNEVMVYVNSKLQKMHQEEEKRIDRHEKERTGTICPKCGMEIPPMTNVCPSCGCIISSSDLSGDKELMSLIDEINNSIVSVKSANDSNDFYKQKAISEGLLRKAEMFYGDNRKIQMLTFELRNELEAAEKKFKSDRRTEVATKAVSNIGPRILAGIGLLIMAEMCIFIVPLLIDGYRDAMGSLWHKVIGK